MRAVQDVPDLATRLMRSFPAAYDRTEVDRVLRSCRADLSGHHEEALPELVERLAHQRLLDGLVRRD